VVPDLRGVRSWMREHRDMSGYLLAEYLLGAGAFQGGILAVGALIGGSEGLAIIGAFRAAQVVLGPLNMLATALQTFALPELSKRGWLPSRQRWKVAVGIGAFMAVVATGYSTVMLLLPQTVGEFLFRSNWDGARDVLLPMAIGVTAGMACQGCAVVIYSMGLARRTFRIMVVEAPLVFTLMIGGALTGGAVGAAWGMCIDQVSLVPLWYLTLRGVLRRAERERDAVAD
jgi:O-antigen/teichoic acid export membrane protein